MCRGFESLQARSCLWCLWRSWLACQIVALEAKGSSPFRHPYSRLSLWKVFLSFETCTAHKNISHQERFARSENPLIKPFVGFSDSLHWAILLLRDFLCSVLYSVLKLYDGFEKVSINLDGEFAALEAGEGAGD